MKYLEVIGGGRESLLSSLFLCKVRASVMGGSIALFRTVLQLNHAYNEPWEARNVNTSEIVNVFCSMYRVIWEH